VLEIQSFEEITQIQMSREIGGNPIYWVASYLGDGLLIDTGCSYTAGELMSFLEKHPPTWVANTPYHLSGLLLEAEASVYQKNLAGDKAGIVRG